ncbi:MAG: hypothetical protein PHF24_02815 [Syntrophomonas sp.]|nr:hypothetical protein [Syntrophomonas sp.]
MEYFSWNQWQFGPMALAGAFLGSLLTIYALRNLDRLGFEGELPWYIARGIIIFFLIIGGWYGGCLAAAFEREKEMLSLLIQMFLG